MSRETPESITLVQWLGARDTSGDRPAGASKRPRGARWPSGLERWLGVATGRSRSGSNPAAVTSLRNFGNSVYPALPVSFGGDTYSRRSLLSGVYMPGDPTMQSALECTCNSRGLHPTTPLNSDLQKCDYAAENAALHLYRKKNRATTRNVSMIRMWSEATNIRPTREYSLCIVVTWIHSTVQRACNQTVVDFMRRTSQHFV